MSKTPARKSAARKSGPASKARSAASKPSAARPVASAEALPPSRSPRASQNILSAGIKALANAHGEVVARQSRVFQSLLGLGQPEAGGEDENRDGSRDGGRAGSAAAGGPAGDKTSAAAALDPFGFKKFEDVFDQRVARTLQRLEVPSAQDFADLAREVERLREELARLRPPGKRG